MATRQATVLRILDELNRTDLSSQAADAIATAIEFYASEDLGFNQTATTFAITTATYTLPADFRSEVAVFVDYSGRRYRACEIEYGEWQDGIDPDDDGFPSRYAFWGNTINFDPAPDRTYTAHIAYIGKLPELSDSASNGFLSDDMEEVIRMHAEADLLMNVIRGPEAVQEAQVKKAQESAAWSRVKARTVRRSARGITRRGLL